MKASHKLLLSIVAVGILAISIPAHAVITFDQNVSPQVIFGSGNGNGSFAVEQKNGVELGLRAKIPYTGIYNSDGLGTYTFSAGTLWNLEWSVNTDWNSANPNRKLDDLTYKLYLNGINGGDLINAPYLDSAIGDNSTLNGAGVEAISAADYANLIAGNNVAQNSWQASVFGINPATLGTYTFRLEALSGGVVLAATEIDVNVTAVPEPSTYIAGALLLLPFGATMMRKLRKA